MLKILLFIFIFISMLGAHQTGLSYIDIKEKKDHTIDVVYKKPLSDTRAQKIYIRYPQVCIENSREPQTIVNGFIIQRYKLWCGDKGLTNSRIWIDGLLAKDRGVLIRYEKDAVVNKSLLRSTTPFMQINHKSTSFELFLEYVHLGIVHIWGGYDHLLFVLALIVLALNMRALLFSITAFTLSHSITLACGILGIVNVGVAYIEAMIALSIVYLARELIIDEKDSFTRRHLEFVTFTFGLLHGFGFSSVLRTIGLPQDEIPLSLFAFNVGIESGQILFIFAVSLVLYVLKKFIKNYDDNIRLYLGYFIGALSSFWLIDRVISF
ncbi:MAG: HupE/UreJ family protein [Epsilonproteobacteria bacterium]|nr:HupE/UreJ family protein [Campylobacterota bacterium]